MDLLIVGTPGPLLAWIGEVARTAAALASPALTLTGDNTDGSLAETARPALLVSDLVDPKQEAAVLNGTLRAIVVIDDAATCLAAQRSKGQGLVASFRNLTICATPLGRLAGCANAHIVMRNDADPAALIRHIFHTGGWAVEGNALATVTRQFAATCPPLVPAAAGDAALLEQVVQPAFRFAATGMRGEVTWPRAVMLWGDHPDQPAPRVLNLTGPAQVLCYGPYFRLPPGHWTARVKLAFSPGCKDAPLALEMHGEARHDRCRFRVPRAGLFEAMFRFAITSPHEAIEIRLVSERGAIEGALGIEHAVLTPVTL